jgi:hypothetical protein
MGLLGILSIIIACGTFTILGIVLIGAFATRGRNSPITVKLRREVPEGHVPKMRIDPKQAIHEPGICQCNCALSYHQGLGKCNVPGCPCMQFIPSDLDPQQLQDVANSQVTQFAIASVQSRLELEAQTANLNAKIEANRQKELGRR